MGSSCAEAGYLWLGSEHRRMFDQNGRNRMLARTGCRVDLHGYVGVQKAHGLCLKRDCAEARYQDDRCSAGGEEQDVARQCGPRCGKEFVTG